MTRNHGLRDVRRQLRELGFRFVRKASHGDLWRLGDNHVLVPNSPGDSRSLKNLQSQIRRAIRQKGNP